MLENLKSSYNLKNIFSFVEEKRKLIILKNNTFFQNKLDINAINIEKLCRRNIIFEENGNGNGEESTKKYHILLFKGEYLNFKRNGK